MLPFPIISNTTKPKSRVVPTTMSSARGIVQMVSSTNKLFVAGTWAVTYLGVVTSSWTNIMNDVQEMYGSVEDSPSVLVKNSTSQWFIRGRNPFDNNYALQWVDVTAKFTALSSISPIKKVINIGTAIGVLLNNGNLYFVGRNTEGQFGINSGTTIFRVFTSVATAVTDFDMKYEWSTYLNTSNQLYSAGISVNGTISGTGTQYIVTWSLQASSVQSFWMRSSTTGGLLIKLTNGTYQVKGVSHVSGGYTSDTTAFTTFTYPRVYNQIIPASRFFYAVDSTGVIYSCGLASLGATAQNSTAIGTITQLFTLVQSLSTKSVSKIWTGGYNTYVLLTNGTVMGCGGGYATIPDYPDALGSFALMTMPFDE